MGEESKGKEAIVSGLTAKSLKKSWVAVDTVV
jgi:hypothetical protein